MSTCPICKEVGKHGQPLLPYLYTPRIQKLKKVEE